MPSPTRVTGSFEPDALAASIAHSVQTRVAEVVTLTIDRLAEDDRELNQLQKIELVQFAVSVFDGVEREVLDEIEREVEISARVDEAAEKPQTLVDLDHAEVSGVLGDLHLALRAMQAALTPKPNLSIVEEGDDG